MLMYTNALIENVIHESYKTISNTITIDFDIDKSSGLFDFKFAGPIRVNTIDAATFAHAMNKTTSIHFFAPSLIDLSEYFHVQVRFRNNLTKRVRKFKIGDEKLKYFELGAVFKGGEAGHIVHDTPLNMIIDFNKLFEISYSRVDFNQYGLFKVPVKTRGPIDSDYDGLGSSEMLFPLICKEQVNKALNKGVLGGRAWPEDIFRLVFSDTRYARLREVYKLIYNERFNQYRYIYQKDGFWRANTYRNICTIEPYDSKYFLIRFKPNVRAETSEKRKTSQIKSAYEKLDTTRSLAQILRSIDQTIGELVQTSKSLQELDQAYKAQQTKNLSKRAENSKLLLQERKEQ